MNWELFFLLIGFGLLGVLTGFVATFKSAYREGKRDGYKSGYNDGFAGKKADREILQREQKSLIERWNERGYGALTAKVIGEKDDA